MVRVYWVPAITKQHGSLNQMSDIGGAAERLSTPAVAPLSFFGRSPKSIKGRQLETRRFHLALLVVNVSWLTESLLHLAFAPPEINELSGENDTRPLQAKGEKPNPPTQRHTHSPPKAPLSRRHVGHS